MRVVLAKAVFANLQRSLQQLLRLDQIATPTQEVSEIRQRERDVRVIGENASPG